MAKKRGLSGDVGRHLTGIGHRDHAEPGAHQLAGAVQRLHHPDLHRRRSGRPGRGRGRHAGLRSEDAGGGGGRSVVALEGIYSTIKSVIDIKLNSYV